MTNSYDLLQNKPHKLIIIHGLNNNPSAFDPLISFFRSHHWDPHLVTLPCHGENRNEASNFQEAIACFERSIETMTNSPYSVLAFSQGALYFQLWLKQNLKRAPLSQVLLAPALAIKRQKLTMKLMKVLPASFKVKSFSPKAIRRYPWLTVGEYRILMEGIQLYQTSLQEVPFPSLIVIDPKDELVDAKALELMKKEDPGTELVLLQRPYLYKPGHHHIIFHPEYFKSEDWITFTKLIEEFLIKHSR